MKHVRVLVVDDSATMRNLITAVLESDPLIEVIGHAADALEARQAIKQHNPDVVTLDVEMPNMNGLDFLEKIMRLRPMPVIMVSTLTGKDAAATIKALEIGAFDCVGKSALGDRGADSILIETVKAAARSKSRYAAIAPVRREGPRTDDLKDPYKANGKVVAIGSSTGGVEALITVLSEFPENCPPTVITQHMPPVFTKSFADRLDRLCRPKVSEAVNGAILAPGQVYIAPGGAAHLEVVGSTILRCRLTASDTVNGHRPSVDVLFSSVAKASGANGVGVILTGMGRDGASGLLQMRQAGAATIGQDEATSLVYGMPKVAFEVGAVERQYPLKKIGSQILALTRLNSDGDNHVVRTTSKSSRGG